MYDSRHTWSVTLTLRILIVEDTPERQEILRQLYRDHAWILVHTAARAITLLEAYEFDVVSLDYDLAGEGKGEDVAIQIKNSASSTARVVVHSMNPQGRDRIRELITDVIIMPVASMITTNTRFKRLREALKQGKDFDW